jgi:hypothetical protein
VVLEIARRQNKNFEEKRLPGCSGMRSSSAGKMINHVGILAIVPPGPNLRKVVWILEPHDQLVFVAGRHSWQVSGTLE